MRSWGLRARGMALAAFVVSLAGAGRAEAQVLVTAERDLEFGLLTPGVPAAVAPTDMIRSAQFRVDGRGRYQLSFILPTELTRTGGGSIPLSWGATDGRLQIRHKLESFDPREPLNFRINPAEQEAQINLGGRALPAAGQPAGTYTATVVMMIVQTGN